MKERLNNLYGLVSTDALCGDGKINAVIDWTTACVHPVVWEIVRSYVYAAPSCKNGEINMDEIASYVSEYQRFAALNEYDLQWMIPLFYYSDRRV